MVFLGFERGDFRFVLNYVKMMFRDRFMGSSLGVVWAVASPILMLGIFTFVFGFVFKSKLPGAETSLSYVIWLISGYGPWLSITESIMTSASAIIAGAQLIKNMKLKSELLSLSAVAMGVVPLAVSLVFLTALMVAEGTAPSLSWLILPVIIVVQFVFVAGIGFLISAIAVFMRDVIHILPNLMMMMMFATPIFYPITVFPKVVQSITKANPFYLLSEWYRQPLLHGTLPPLWTLAYLICVSGALFIFGLFVFRRLSRYFESRL